MKGRSNVACLGALLLLLPAATACGPRVAPQGVAAADPTATALSVRTEVASPTPDEEGTHTPPPEVDGGSGETPQPSASPSAPQYGPRHNNGVVGIELSATCVRPGDLLVVTLRTPPKAGLGMIIGFSDNQAHGAMLTGESDDTGRYVWRVPIEPTVPDGPAKVLVTSTGANWEREGGGTADARFTVIRAGC